MKQPELGTSSMRAPFFAVVAAAVLTAGASWWPKQDRDADDWTGITEWSGTIRVEVTEGGNVSAMKARLTASANGSVTLQLAEVRDRPRRVIWIGENVTFSATFESEATMEGGGTTSSGSGRSPGGSVELFMNLDEETYRVSLLDAGEGITGTATFTAGGFSQSGSAELLLEEVQVRAEDIPLPPSVGALTGSQNLERSYSPMAAARSGSISWSLSPCTGGDAPALAIDPTGWDAMVFDEDGSEGRAEELAIANNVSKQDSARVVWTFPEIPGVWLTTDPESGRGQYVKVTYTNLPEDNGAFAVEEPVTASLSMCSEEVTAEMPVRFFFALKGTFNPDDEDVPNWFYYWRQTAAGRGLSRSQVHYSPPQECQDDDPTKKTFGFYVPGDSHINVCDPVTGSGWNSVTGEFTDGIDTYATTVLHEWEHKKHYEQWWRNFDQEWTTRTGGPKYEDPCVHKTCWTPEYRRDRRTVDRDRDKIPDRLERSLGMNPKWQDTHRCKMTDEHYLAWLAEGLWQSGTADEEDWAAPGKRFGTEPVQRNENQEPLCGIAATGRPSR